MITLLPACSSGIHNKPENIANEFLDRISDKKTSELNELFYTTDTFNPDSYFEQFYGVCKIGFGDNYKIKFSNITISDFELEDSELFGNINTKFYGIDTSRPISDYMKVSFKWSIAGSLDSSVDESSFLVVKEGDKWYIHDCLAASYFTLTVIGDAERLDGVLD